MQAPRQPRQLDLLGIEPDAVRDARRQLADPLRVAAGVCIARVDRLRQRCGRAVARRLVGAGGKPLELRELDDVRPVAADAVLPVLFRPVESAVRQPDQLVAAVPLQRERRQARAHGDGADVIEVDARDSLDDGVGGGECHALVVTAEQQRELVTAEPEGLAALAQPARHLREHAVAGGMAEAVVDLLEVVDVDEAQRQRRALLLGVEQLALEAFVEVAVVAESGEWIGEREAHRSQRVVRGALVERDREQRPDQRGREHGRALPQHDEHQRRGGHERERRDRRPEVFRHEAQVALARAERDRAGDEEDVDDRVSRRRDQHARDEPADGVVADRRDQRAGRERDDREHGDVECDPLEGPVLREMDCARRDEEQQRACRPAVQHDRGHCEHERERDDAAAALDVDRHREALGERRGGGQRHEADERPAGVLRRREDIGRRNEHGEPRETDRSEKGGKPARRDRLCAHRESGTR